MKYKDTLTLYEELVASGTPEGQAKIMAHQQGALADSTEGIGSRVERISNNIDKTLMSMEKKLDVMGRDIYWMKLIGSVMAVTFSAHFLSPLFK
jgi:hypothetical protein